MDYIVGLDFGTHGSALSFALKQSKEVFERIKWNEKHERETTHKIGMKIRTSILLKKLHCINTINKNDILVDKVSFVAFGNDANNKYINKDKFIDIGSKDWLYFEYFKMALYSLVYFMHLQHTYHYIE